MVIPLGFKGACTSRKTGVTQYDETECNEHIFVVCKCRETLGILRYKLFVGQPPFYTDSVYVFIRHIVKDPVKYPDNMSANFKSCLKDLLNKLPQSRLTWPALLEHPFVKDDSVELAAATQTTPFEVKGSGATRKADEIQTSRNQPSIADPQECTALDKLEKLHKQ